MRLAYVVCGIGVSVVFGSPASASGLVMSTPAGDRAGAALGPLRTLSVEARLGAGGAEITERRGYALATGAGAGGVATVTYYASGGGVQTVNIAGRPVGVTTLSPSDADVVRQRLVGDLREPAPLRQLGGPLAVTEAVEVAVPASGIIAVDVTTHLGLTAHGTLSGIVLPIDWARAPVDNVVVKVDAMTDAPLRVLYAPFHELAVVRDSPTQVHASYVGSHVCTDFDLTLLLSSGTAPVQLDLLPFRYGDEEGGSFAAFVTPDPTPVVNQVLPRDIVFVVDTSGSMAGIKMTQAKEALRGVLQGLRPGDSFALLSFSDVVKSFQSNALPATADNVAAAVAFVDALKATGGTNIYDALHAGFGALPVAAGHPRYVVFLTDGQPTVGKTNIEDISAMAKADNEGRARIFSFGIGDDVNTVLLDRLARESSGDVIYVRPSQSVAAAVQDFFLRISDPVLANPVLDMAAFAAADVFPEVMPDLYAGGVVTLYGRTALTGRGQVTLSGTRNGQPWAVGYDVVLPDHALASGYVPRIWATRKVGRLLAEVKQGNSDPALPTEALALASRYGVTTSFTNFVVDAAGDVAMRYTAVPMAQSGTVAVDTSSSLRGYGKSDSVQTAANVPVRYVADRSLPVQGGYLTDTKSPPNGAAVDLVFGSERYFAWAAAEAPFGAAALLAAGPNARFELLGRAFRVTDPAALPSGATTAPEESVAVPDPTWRPTAGSVTTVTVAGAGAVIPMPGGPGNPTSDPAVPRATLPSPVGSGCGCAVGASGGADGPVVGTFALSLAFLLSGLGRRRPRATR